MAKLKMEQERSAHSRKYRIRVRTANAEFEGLFYSPHPERRLSEVLAKMEPFLNLKDARDLLKGDSFPFVIVAKSAIESIKVVQEWD